MRILITGIAGFVGATLARGLKEAGHDVFGVDNFIRPGSEANRLALRKIGIGVSHADIRSQSDIEALPKADYLIDAAANPSVLAGVDGKTGPRQLLEHNLLGTVNLLEYCRRENAGFILLSTSRVYGVDPLSQLPVKENGRAFELDERSALPVGVTHAGVSEAFSTAAPVSLYGSSKLASEVLALEYSSTFGFPVWINRCGVLAGAGQFGRPDQGIFAYWINAWLHRKPLRYIGFGGCGFQVRDGMHPLDLIPLLQRQMQAGSGGNFPRVINLGGGMKNAFSLRELSGWCEERFGPHSVEVDTQHRPFDIPWMVMDAGLAHKAWGWRPATRLLAILDEIADHAERNPDWLDISAP